MPAGFEDAPYRLAPLLAPVLILFRVERIPLPIHERKAIRRIGDDGVNRVLWQLVDKIKSIALMYVLRPLLKIDCVLLAHVESLRSAASSACFWATSIRCSMNSRSSLYRCGSSPSFCTTPAE